MRCNNCGFENADNATHCIKCNMVLDTAAIKQAAPATRKEAPFAGTIADNQFDHPSAPLINCPHPDCGYPYSSELKVCPRCRRPAGAVKPFNRTIDPYRIKAPEEEKTPPSFYLRPIKHTNMKSSHISSFVLLIMMATAGTVRAQTSTISDMMQTSLNKIRSSSQAGRVVERTFSDMFFREDTTGNNCLFFHRFSSSNNYRINAFALSGNVSNIDVGVYRKDNNNKWNKITGNTTSGYDVSLRFSPPFTGSYAVFIRGTLRTNINNALFNLIIERE